MPQFDATDPKEWDRLARDLEAAWKALDKLPEDAEIDAPLADAMDNAYHHAGRLHDLLRSILL